MGAGFLSLPSIDPGLVESAGAEPTGDTSPSPSAVSSSAPVSPSFVLAGEPAPGFRSFGTAFDVAPRRTIATRLDPMVGSLQAAAGSRGFRFPFTNTLLSQRNRAKGPFANFRGLRVRRA